MSTWFNPADFFYLDHVQVGSAVPEPGSLSVLALNLLMWKRRARRGT
jgi:hypothetical protein